MKVVDLTSQTAVCGDMVSNLAMVAQEMKSGEEVKVKMPKEYKKDIDVYKDMLKMLNVEVTSVEEEDDALVITLKKA
ncbi:hypothetical protein IPA_03625 [Ignicoccus pacificus DSM 13166]|uniref:Uncharacterized protein n=1 Tax=Ignicoccus pacificus DSM 13166 TaxID=940294 RepID=A0A977KBZ8_9CREN|nr:hypothetical protein IPA_03625 [Ignicoccus pacificus DSM 13166]